MIAVTGKGVRTGSGRVVVKRMTLIEVGIAIAIAGMVIGGVMMSFFMAAQSTMLASHHATAMQLCIELAEQMRADEFEDLVADNYPNETGLVLMDGERGRNPLLCDRSVVISDADSEGIEARRVAISVDWTYRGMQSREDYETIIYQFH